jgi:ribosomal protein S18 acetylase RimI-like enzyme
MRPADAIPIRRMTKKDYPEVLAVTSRAFWFDPLIDFFSKNLLHEYRMLPSLFSGYLKDVMAPGARAWVGEHQGRPRGIAGWLPPGGYPRPTRQEVRRNLYSAAALTRGRHRLMAVRLLTEVDKHHPHEPHWYLALLATDPTVQGRGVGTALLAPILEQCDEEGILAYTETQKEANVSWYARAGFAVTREVQLPGTPPVWCLRRQPHAGPA